MRFSLPIAGLLGLLCLGGPARAGSPEDLVSIFYDGVPDISSPDLRDHFADPALSVIVADEKLKSGEDQMGCIDFVVQIDAQDFDPAVVEHTLAFEEKIEGDRATVTASFDAFEGGSARQRVVWSLIARDNIWKVSDVESPAGGWRLGDFTCDP